jgi:hypothetical protein
MSQDNDNPFRADIPDDDIPTLPGPAHSPWLSPPAPDPQSKREELLRRQRELEDRQRRLQGERAEFVPAPNFPPFAPIFVFNLDRDIPKRAHSCLTSSLYGLIAVTASVFLNIFAILCVRGLPTFHHVRSMVFGIVQGFGTVYVVFNYSFLKLYGACRKKDIPFSWTVSQFVVVAWIVYLAIGFPDSGCVGLATFLDLLAKSPSKFSMFVAAINTGLIVAVAYFQVVTLYKAQGYQKVSGQEDLGRPVVV